MLTPHKMWAAYLVLLLSASSRRELVSLHNNDRVVPANCRLFREHLRKLEEAYVADFQRRGVGKLSIDTIAWSFRDARTIDPGRAMTLINYYRTRIDRSTVFPGAFPGNQNRILLPHPSDKERRPYPDWVARVQTCGESQSGSGDLASIRFEFLVSRYQSELERDSLFVSLRLNQFSLTEPITRAILNAGINDKILPSSHAATDVTIRFELYKASEVCCLLDPVNRNDPHRTRDLVARPEFLEHLTQELAEKRGIQIVELIGH